MSNLPPDDDQPQSAPISSAERDAMEARRGSPREILLLLMLLLVLMLIAFATGRGMLIRFGGPSGPSSSTAPTSTSGAIGQGTPPAARDQLAAMEAARPQGSLASACSPPNAAQRVSPRFRPYYDQHGRVETFGLPISQEIIDNGLVFQWFERARLEYHPEDAGTQHEIIGGLVGVEFTKGILFP